MRHQADMPRMGNGRMGNGRIGDPRSRSRPREGVAQGAVPGGRERRAKPTQQPRADGPAGGPMVNAAAGAMEIERLLVDHISDAVFATDVADRVTHWTASAERLFGYTAGEAVGRSFGDLLPFRMERPSDCLLYTSDAADDLTRV